MSKYGLDFVKRKFYKGKYFIVSFIVVFALVLSAYFISLITANNEVLGDTSVENLTLRPESSSGVTYKDIVEIKYKNPLLINKSNKLPDDFVPDNLVKIVNERMATLETKDAYMRMRDAAILDGVIFYITSAYRSIDYQRALYEKAVKEKGIDIAEREVARPGHSEHHTGRALDLIGSFGGLDDFIETPEYKWIVEHAHEYGFIIRYGADMENVTGYIHEPWHITYVGLVISQEMKQQNIKTLEEYILKNPDAHEIYESNSKIVVIDPGHGDDDPGCIWGGIEEKTVNLNIAKKLRKILIEKGYVVFMTRNDDSFLSRSDRVEIASAYNADIFVSIHQNSFEQTNVHGLETWYDNTATDKDNFTLANLIHNETVRATGAMDRGLREDTQIYVTTNNKMPSCLIETGYMSNDSERALLISENYQEKIAQGIAAGIDLFFKPKEISPIVDDEH